MKEFCYTITDPEGIHARPAGEFVKEAKKFASDVKIVKGEKSADAKKIFGLMSLGVKQGEEILVQIEGTDEEEAATGLEKFLKENL
ncbi:MAG: HPr family phosphocarrier protein [Lachnospiraceae bacterium]|nr:HPr family phosphocarrier protein [Lachnospiraceae bacterium]